MKKILVAAALAGTTIAGVAFAAQTETAPRGGAAVRADANNDGTITRAEFAAQADARFARLDANKDGRVSRDEMNARRAKRGPHGRGPGMRHTMGGGRGAGMIEKLDANKDGRVSRDEMRDQALAHATKRFDRLDANRDGSIDQAEMAAMHAKWRGRARD